MVSQFEASIVRVFGTENRVIGTGFLITSNHIITCSHVISQALNQADSIFPPREMVFVDFPFLEREQFFSARVVHWLPKKGSTDDIAVLMIETPKPEKAAPVVIVTDEELTGRNVRTHGFPAGYEDDGRSALSVIVGPLAGGRLSIQGTSSYGVWVESGFSGAPVWDDALNAVVGMVVTVSTGVERSASIIPASMFSQYVDTSQSRRGVTNTLGGVVDYSLGSAIRSTKTSDSFVFISYSHHDGEDIAKLLHDALERNGCRVWIDYKDLGSNPGTLWSKAIDEAIEECSTFIAIVTPLGVNSLQVQSEWILALDELKPSQIIPVIVRPVRIPRHFRLFQWIDLTDSTNARTEIGKLVRKLGCSSGDGGHNVPPFPSPTPSSKSLDSPEKSPITTIMMIDEARAYAMALLRKRDYDRLIQWSNELDAKLQEDAYILALRAVAQDAIGNVRDALDDYTKAIQLDPQDANLYVQRASLNVDVGNVREAFEDFEKALKLNPDLQEVIDTETAAIVIFVREPDQLPVPLFDQIEGRAEISALARKTLQTGERVLFYGIGGIGKTALSTVIAREYLAEKRTVLWVNVGSARLETLLNAIGQELERALDKDKAFKQAESVDEKTNYISDLLKRENPLLVLDDAWNPEETKQFLISVVPLGCPTIVTTRRTDFDDIPGLIKLNLAELSVESAVNLYQAINENDKNRHAVEELCRILGFHPLAIRLAALMGKNRGMGAALTLTQLRNSQVKNPIRAIFDGVIKSAAEDNRKVFIAIGALPVPRVTDEFVALILDEPVEAVAAKSHYLADQGLINPTISPEGEAFYAVHDLTYAYAHDLLLEQGKHATLEHKVVEAACGYVAKHADNFSKLAVEKPTLIASITRAKGYQDHASIYALVDGLLTFLDYQGYAIDHFDVLSIASETAEIQSDKRKQAWYWNELATVFVKLGHYKQAIQYFEMALVVSREFRDRRSEGRFIGNLANVYVSLVELDRAVEYYESSLNIVREIGDRAGEATTLNNLSNVWSRRGNKRKALELYEHVLPIMREVSDKRGEATTLGSIGTVWDDLGEKQKALEYYEQALVISSEIGDRRNEAVSLTNIGEAFNDLGETQKALQFYERAIGLYREIGDTKAEVTTQNNLRIVRLSLILDKLNVPIRNRADIPDRIQLCLQALEMVSREENDQRWAALQNELGNSIIQNPFGDRSENLEQSISHYQQALEVYTREANPERWAATQNNLATAYRNRIRGSRSENLEQAINHYQQALTVVTRAATPLDWAQTLNNLANAYANRLRRDRAENLEQAINHYQQALTVVTQDTMPVAWAITMMNLGNAYRNRIKGNKAENIEVAIQALGQARSVMKQNAMPVDWAQTMMNLGNAFADRIHGDRAENIEQAIAAYQQALTVRTRDAMPIEWATTMMNLADAYLDRVSGESIDNTRQAIQLYEGALETFGKYGHEAISKSISERILKASARLDKLLDDEGRGIGQEIHDVSPDASLAFRATSDQADFAQGILDLAAAGVDVIVDDILYLGEPMLQDGVIAQSVNQVEAMGIPYFSSAGNDARQSYESLYRSSEITGE